MFSDSLRNMGDTGFYNSDGGEAGSIEFEIQRVKEQLSWVDDIIQERNREAEKMRSSYERNIRALIRRARRTRGKNTHPESTAEDLLVAAEDVDIDRRNSEENIASKILPVLEEALGTE